MMALVLVCDLFAGVHVVNQCYTSIIIVSNIKNISVVIHVYICLCPSVHASVREGMCVRVSARARARVCVCV